ncbi:hypothetical protein AVEN_269791-1 [Araneus ventricosus]|uniref:Uncharacterized protein n=1 Tax=Araneus ventricosus TaxID=182803 RepID=A0A4Y2PB12_ARAVE|nr:hypothetical protein AVEN_269791-1 [Araneus ventricosus]
MEGEAEPSKLGMFGSAAVGTQEEQVYPLKTLFLSQGKETDRPADKERKRALARKRGVLSQGQALLTFIELGCQKAKTKKRLVCSQMACPIPRTQ